jgi:hypothetical protein
VRTRLRIRAYCVYSTHTCVCQSVIVREVILLPEPSCFRWSQPPWFPFRQASPTDASSSHSFTFLSLLNAPLPCSRSVSQSLFLVTRVQGNHDEAVEWFERAYTCTHGMPPYFQIVYATSLLQVKDGVEKAKRLCDRALSHVEHEPQLTLGFMTRGFANHALGYFEYAIQDYTRFLDSYYRNGVPEKVGDCSSQSLPLCCVVQCSCVRR